jgi:hypothetical protein
MHPTIEHSSAFRRRRKQLRLQFTNEVKKAPNSRRNGCITLNKLVRVSAQDGLVGRGSDLAIVQLRLESIVNKKMNHSSKQQKACLISIAGVGFGQDCPREMASSTE